MDSFDTGGPADYGDDDDGFDEEKVSCDVA
jgi:hypothetical protein